MFRHVVVGIDEDPGSRDALALARALLGKDGRLTLAHVHRGDPRIRTVSPELAATERTGARRLLESVRAQAGDDARLQWTGAASVGRGLHEIAEHDDADLLVVGSSRHTLFGHATLSAHTREALNGAPRIRFKPFGPGCVKRLGRFLAGLIELLQRLVNPRAGLCGGYLLENALGFLSQSLAHFVQRPASPLLDGGIGCIEEDLFHLCLKLIGQVTCWLFRRKRSGRFE